MCKVFPVAIKSRSLKFYLDIDFGCVTDSFLISKPSLNTMDDEPGSSNVCGSSFIIKASSTGENDESGSLNISGAFFIAFHE